MFHLLARSFVRFEFECKLKIYAFASVVYAFEQQGEMSTLVHYKCWLFNDYVLATLAPIVFRFTLLLRCFFVSWFEFGLSPPLCFSMLAFHYDLDRISASFFLFCFTFCFAFCWLHSEYISSKMKIHVYKM